MANQVYFPQYRQIFNADSAAFIIVSHPETGRAYKIRVDALKDALANSLISTNVPNAISLGTDGLLLVDAADLISSDSSNVLEVGADDLLTVANVYTADGVFSGDRTIDANANDFTVEDAANIDLYSTTHVVLHSTSGANVANIAALPTTSAMQVTDGTSTSNLAVTSETILLNPDVALYIGDGVGGTVGDVLQLLDSSSYECGWVTQRKSYIGSGTLVNGTITIADTNVAAGCSIQLTPTALNATVGSGVIRVTSKTNGVGFTVTSINPGATATASTDQSSFDYVIIK